MKDIIGDTSMQEQVGMDCLGLLSDKDLQLLGLSHEHRQLVKDAIANMQFSSWSGILDSTETPSCLPELIREACQPCLRFPGHLTGNDCTVQLRR